MTNTQILTLLLVNHKQSMLKYKGNYYNLYHLSSFEQTTLNSGSEESTSRDFTTYCGTNYRNYNNLLFIDSSLWLLGFKVLTLTKFLPLSRITDGTPYEGSTLRNTSELLLTQTTINWNGLKAVLPINVLHEWEENLLSPARDPSTNGSLLALVSVSSG